MTKETNPPPLALNLEAARRFEAGDLQVLAGFRAVAAEFLSGGAVEVEFFVENTGGTPFYLAVGGDRARLRPSFFSFAATLEVEGAEVLLDDPAARIIDRGGPVTRIQVKTNAPYRKTLLVNEFVRLEKTIAALFPGQAGVLRLRCQRSLPMASVPEQAFKMDSDAPVVEAALVFHVRRDDTALEALSARLATEVRANQTVTVSAEREQTIAKLAALRNPVAVQYLQALSDHPDPVVKMYVVRTVALLNLNKDV
jgi:hypothetical protein